MQSSSRITIGSLTPSAEKVQGAAVIIDVFRAFTTAAVAFANGAKAIIMVGDVPTALSLRENGRGSRCIGERHGLRPDGFDYGNSPSEIRKISFAGEVLIQTTSNGTKGVITASSASTVFAASLINAKATVKVLGALQTTDIGLIAAGDGADRTDEDEICALYMRALLRGRAPGHDAIRDSIAALSPRIDGQTLTAEDFAACVDIDAIPIAIKIERQEDLCIALPVYVDR